jgi:uncharacterized membrane protein YiaA
MKWRLDILSEVCFGVGFATFLLFGYYQSMGRTEWGYFYVGTLLLAIFTAYWTIQKGRKRVVP